MCWPCEFLHSFNGHFTEMYPLVWFVNHRMWLLYNCILLPCYPIKIEITLALTHVWCHHHHCPSLERQRPTMSDLLIHTLLDWVSPLCTNIFTKFYYRAIDNIICYLTVEENAEPHLSGLIHLLLGSYPVVWQLKDWYHTTIKSYFSISDYWLVPESISLFPTIGPLKNTFFPLVCLL